MGTMTLENEKETRFARHIFLILLNFWLQDFKRSFMCYAELHGYNDPKQFVKTPTGKAAFSTADIGKMVTIQGDQIKVNDRMRFVDWSQAAHSNCSGKIETVEDKVLGLVRLESGDEFQNPGGIVHEFHDRGTYVVRMPMHLCTHVTIDSHRCIELVCTLWCLPSVQP